jgi:SAM-dependent methyltransferase
MKFKIIGAVRALGLLKFADTCKFRLGQFKAQRRNAMFAREHPGFPTPPPHLAFDALNHVDWYSYLDSGTRHAGIFARVISTQMPDQGPLDVLEWGCGPGRLIRHIPGLLGDRLRTVTGADYNKESIAWCRANLSGIEFRENALLPPLPFADASFDVVYNFSVFTHLSESVQLEWVAELVRVLRPGGLLICTTHGDAFRYLLANKAEQARFDAGDVVVQGNYEEGKKWYFAIHPDAFVTGKLLSGLDQVARVEKRDDETTLQDVWVARKPCPPSN